MRAYLWNRCLVNGLTTWILGYVILVPYMLVYFVATMWRGHSWPVLHGITPEMHLDRNWVNEPSKTDKNLAILSAALCWIPGIGILLCVFVLWKTHWCTGWVHRTTNIAALVSWVASAIALNFCLETSW